MMRTCVLLMDPPVEESTAQRAINKMGQAELDHFFARIDLDDPQMKLSHPDAHWRFRSNYHIQKGALYNADDSPALLYNGIGVTAGQKLNARRVAYILHFETDPGSRQTDLETVCGCDCCVNPLHQQESRKSAIKYG